MTNEKGEEQDTMYSYWEVDYPHTKESQGKPLALIGNENVAHAFQEFMQRHGIKTVIHPIQIPINVVQCREQ